MKIEIVLALSVFFLLVPVLLTRWLWYWVFSLVFGLPMVGVWGLYFYETSLPQQTGSPGDFFGIVVMVLLSGSLAAGMFLRFIRWVIELKAQEIKAARILNSSGSTNNT